MVDYKDLRIIFMGTPEFAVASLDVLVNAGCKIVGVITSPDKPAGRGLQLQQSAVKKYADQKHLNILQPEKLKNSEFLKELKQLKADLQIVVAFRMLPEIVWNMPPLGTINVHGSLLPQYRGAAPINWAIINGENQTGVTTFKLKHEIDTGNILQQQIIDIDENETAGELHDKMKFIGAELLLKTIESMAKNELHEIIQNEELIETNFNHAPKLFTEKCSIDWNKNVDEVYNLIRGLSPYPTAFTTLQNKKLKIFSALKIHENHSHKIGEYETDHKNFIRFACKDGFISITDLQLEGKKRMLVAEFLRGFRV